MIPPFCFDHPYFCVGLKMLGDNIWLFAPAAMIVGAVFGALAANWMWKNRR